MSYKVEEIEGIGQAYAVKLNEDGIFTTEELLREGATRRGREKLAADTGISEKLILKWVNHADLFRIKGVAGQFAELLEAAGVDTVKEFAHRKAENLEEKLVSTNLERNLCNRVPSVRELERMIAQAKEMEPVVTY